MEALKLESGFDVRNVGHLDALMRLFCESIAVFFSITVTVEQEKIAKEMIFRVLLRKRHTIDISACRQIGKTEIICYVVWFLMYIFPRLMGEPFRCIMTAPEQRTGSEVFDRTKKLFDKCELERPEEFHFKQKNLDVIVLPNESRIDVFGLFKGFARREDKKTTKEGRSAHVIIRDEKHLGDDLIFKDELEPALSTTGGIDIWLGNGGYRQCRAKEISEIVGRDDVTTFRFDFDYMKKAMVAEYERTKNPMFMRWLDSQLKYVDDYGLESDEVQKNLYLKWIVEIGNFISWENLISHRRMVETGFFSTIADAGLDFAKEKDETVLTITDYERNIRDWQIFRGEYPDQVEQIAEYLLSVGAEQALTLRFLFCDSTGVGDPLREMLKRRLRIPVRGIAFTAQSKDILGKKMMNAFTTTNPRMRMSYPYNHVLRPKFEEQFRKLVKERRQNGQLNYKHPDENNAKDDFPDSFALSLWRIERIRGLSARADDEE